ncbi:LPS assembly lipoprotein LptE [Terriglobus saanensis]|uniref:Lipoprotein n=1 Tax=Terriglobus saanensis (strain ATCC BAA-1853 / DSM 23119 / SP1PR4) TaxID=401053 RepID=E8V5H7_TERSS|nr:LPS assembly lipoprotein LptE [Terriglobus saanensis]ADV81511.1 hypothetical protein AciPR4_0677 [Terriglobus saanensis SP1PR4]
MRSLLGLGLVLLTGCGYHTAGSATHIPAGISVLAIPTFKNRTHAYHTEVAFTSAVIHEMNTRTKYRIINSATAPSDATLEGTILTESVAPLTYDSSSGATSSYLITLTAKVVLTSSTGRVLYQNSKFSFRQQYQSTQDLSAFVQEDTPAVDRMARDFAQTLVSDILESL